MTDAARRADNIEREEFVPAGKPWREDGEVIHLIGMRCTKCGTKAFPAREVCGACGTDAVEPVELATTGSLYSFSQVHVGPKGFPVPYVVAYVDLDDGVRLFGQMEGAPDGSAPDGSAPDGLALDGLALDGLALDGLALDQRVAVVSGLIRVRPDGTRVISYKFRRLVS